MPTRWFPLRQRLGDAQRVRHWKRRFEAIEGEAGPPDQRVARHRPF